MQLPDFIRRGLYDWAKRLMGSRDPDFEIATQDTPDKPYLLRWWVIPRNRFFNVYLHKFLNGDPDRELHDHPWLNMSVLLQGSYMEHLPGDKVKFRNEGYIYFRLPTASHRIELYKGADGKPAPATTIFITGPKIREWGFWCKHKDGSPRWVHWEKFTSNVGNQSFTGKGCGDG